MSDRQSTRTMYYRPVNYDRMKNFLRSNEHLFPQDQLCTQYEESCSCVRCWEETVDRTLPHNPREASELAEELVDNLRMGNGFNFL